MAAHDPRNIARVREALNRAARVTVLTGAGVSAASGVPTFRGAGGLWRNVRPETLATPDAFRRDPRLVWEWYDWRRQRISDAQPNAAHEVLARWTRNRPGVTLVTQNVDGLHERAGSRRLLRLHGSIWRLRCADDCDPGQEDWEDLSVPLVPLPPRCPACGQFARPAVVWFGETLDPAILAAAVDACTADVFLACGTSAVVYPAAGLIDIARERGALTVEINTHATEASGRVDVTLGGPADVVLPALDA